MWQRQAAEVYEDKPSAARATAPGRRIQVYIIYIYIYIYNCYISFYIYLHKNIYIECVYHDSINVMKVCLWLLNNPPHPPAHTHTHTPFVVPPQRMQAATAAHSSLLRHRSQATVCQTPLGRVNVPSHPPVHQASRLGSSSKQSCSKRSGPRRRVRQWP